MKHLIPVVVIGLMSMGLVYSEIQNPAPSNSSSTADVTSSPGVSTTEIPHTGSPTNTSSSAGSTNVTTVPTAKTSATPRATTVSSNTEHSSEQTASFFDHSTPTEWSSTNLTSTTGPTGKPTDTTVLTTTGGPTDKPTDTTAVPGSSTASPTDPPKHKLSGGVIAAIVILVLIVVGASIAGVVYWIKKKRGNSESYIRLLS